MTYSAIDWFSRYLTNKMTVFEWGSGGSTAFFSRRAKQVFTIEHNPTWYQEVVTTIAEKRYSNVKIGLVLPEKCDFADIWYTSTDAQYSGFSFENYVRAIDIYPDDFLDVVIVDGRARPGCIRQAIPKIKFGGYLVLDNSERLEYINGINLITSWKSKIFVGPVPYNDFPSETRIWQKPSS